MPHPTPASSRHASARTLRRLALACAVAAVAAAQPALAQEGNERDDRFVLRLSAFNPSAELKLGVDGEASDGITTVPFSDTASMDTGSEWRPRGAMGFRISDRQAIGASYYDYENDDTWNFGGGSIDPGPPTGPIDIPAFDASGRISFAMASVHYEYAVVATPAFEWGLGIGATHVDLETVIDVGWAAGDGIDAGDARLRDELSGWSPAVHTRLTWRPADRWRLDLEGQYLDAAWGDFVDESGHFERAGLVLEYLVNDRLGVHVGYDWFRLRLREQFGGGITPPPGSGLDPIDFGGHARGELKVHGPLAGVTFRF